MSVQKLQTVSRAGAERRVAGLENDRGEGGLSGGRRWLRCGRGSLRRHNRHSDGVRESPGDVGRDDLVGATDRIGGEDTGRVDLTPRRGPGYSDRGRGTVPAVGGRGEGPRRASVDSGRIGRHRNSGHPLLLRNDGDRGSIGTPTPSARGHLERPLDGGREGPVRFDEAPRRRPYAGQRDAIAVNSPRLAAELDSLMDFDGDGLRGDLHCTDCTRGTG